MSMFAGQDDLTPLGRANVLYSIKGDPNPHPDSPVHRFDVDVYVVYQSERIANPSLTYRAGGNEDVTIEVALEDMGLPQGADPFFNSLSEIRAEMEDIVVVFEAEN